MGWLNLNRWWLILTTFVMLRALSGLCGTTGTFPGVYGLFQAEGQWHLESLGAEVTRNVICGKGVVVALVDSGVDAEHPALKGHLLLELGYNFGDNNTDTSDFLGHGTGVAGAILEVAPCAKILPLKMNRGGEVTFDSSNLARALDYLIRLIPEHPEIRVVNMSISLDEEDPEVSWRIERLISMGITVVAAAGNTWGEVAPPADIEGVIAVGGVDRNGNPSSFSARGNRLFVMAPAEEIRVPYPGGGYRYMYGTSVASGLVAGIAAAVSSLGQGNTPLSIAEGAEDAGWPGYDGLYGFGIASAIGAVATTLKGIETLPTRVFLEPGEREEVLMAPKGKVLWCSMGSNVEADVDAQEGTITIEALEEGKSRLFLLGNRGIGTVRVFSSTHAPSVLELLPVPDPEGRIEWLCIYARAREGIKRLYLRVTNRDEEGFISTRIPVDVELEPGRYMTCISANYSPRGIEEVLLCSEEENVRCTRHVIGPASQAPGE